MTTNRLLIGVWAFWAVAGAGAAVAQPVAAESQYWLGVIEIPGRRAVQQVPIVVTLDRVWSPTGDQWGGRFDISPGPSSMGVRGIPVSDVMMDGRRMHFVTPGQGGEAVYDLVQSEDGKRAEGSVGTASGAMGVRLRRVSAEVAQGAVIRRPQEPSGAFGYVARDVIVGMADGTTVYGTITIPQGMSKEKPAPGVVLIGDIGASDRDMADAFHRPFLVLADALTRAGFAVLRVDDRGVGQSSGDERMLTPELAAADAAAALAALAGTEGVDPARVGFVGLGEGAVTGAIAATDASANGAGAKTAPAFIVMLSPRGVPMLDSQLAAAELMLKREGEVGDYAAARMAARRRALAGAAESTKPYDAVGEPTGPIADALRDELKAYSGFGRGDVSPMQETQGVTTKMAEMTTPSCVSRYRHDPAPIYQRVGVPVLVVGGREDMINPVEPNVPATIAALEKAPGAKVSNAILPGLNHVLQPCVTGLDQERVQIETTIDPGALALITGWLKGVGGLEK